MIAAWMLYTCAATALLAVAARLVEGGWRRLRLPERYLWLGALAGALLLLAVAPLRVPASNDAASARFPAESASPGQAAGDGGTYAGAAALLASVRTAMQRPLQIVSGVGGGAEAALRYMWLLLTAGLLVMAVATQAHYWLLRRRWPAVELDGTRVLVAPASGPAVMGLVRPEIVVPAWLLQRAEPERRLVLLHEREHVRARDPVTLLAGAVAVVAAPWNPAAWWLLRRLRLAVELDCDARVLRSGVPRRAYGSMLIDLAGHAGLAPGVPIRAGTTAQLERRLLAMSAGKDAPRVFRGSIGAAAAALALFAACDTSLPSATVPGAASGVTPDVRMEDVRLTVRPASDFDGIIFIDGRRADPSRLGELLPEHIAAMEVVKGSRAAALYDDPAAANGVILITTRRD